jgi:hypothetical protein
MRSRLMFSWVRTTVQALRTVATFSRKMAARVTILGVQPTVEPTRSAIAQEGESS